MDVDLEAGDGSRVKDLVSDIHCALDELGDVLQEEQAEFRCPFFGCRRMLTVDSVRGVGDPAGIRRAEAAERRGRVA